MISWHWKKWLLHIMCTKSFSALDVVTSYMSHTSHFRVFTYATRLLAWLQTIVGVPQRQVAKQAKSATFLFQPG